jgi:hypothetical protein
MGPGCARSPTAARRIERSLVALFMLKLAGGASPDLRPLVRGRFSTNNQPINTLYGVGMGKWTPHWCV